MSLLPGGHFFENYTAVLFGHGSNSAPVARMMWVSTVMALVIEIGQISISMLSAFAVVYFRFLFRMFFFWMILVTLMLPVEVRIQRTDASRVGKGMVSSCK